MTKLIHERVTIFSCCIEVGKSRRIAFKYSYADIFAGILAISGYGKTTTSPGITIIVQQIFITNLKKIRKERGLSQMTLSEKCDTTSNYIGQIEMGRRIPSFEKIDKIAAALEIPSHELFIYEAAEKKDVKKPKNREYLQKIPQNIKKEIISRLLTAINKDVKASFEAKNYEK